MAATQIVDIAALEEYLLDDDDYSCGSDEESSYYSSDEESVEGVSDPILDSVQEKLVVHGLKQKARARRLKRRAAKKAMKKAQHEEAETDTTEEGANDSEECQVTGDVPDDDSIHAHMKRSGSGMSLAALGDALDAEEEKSFHDFEEEEEEEVELELEFELPLDLEKDAPAFETKA